MFLLNSQIPHATLSSIRTNTSPEVTHPFCRIPLPAFNIRQRLLTLETCRGLSTVPGPARASFSLLGPAAAGSPPASGPRPSLTDSSPRARRTHQSRMLCAAGRPMSNARSPVAARPRGIGLLTYFSFATDRAPSLSTASLPSDLHRQGKPSPPRPSPFSDELQLLPPR